MRARRAARALRVGEGAFQPPANNVELTVWNPFTGPDGNFFSQIVDDFNAATPTVKVTVQTQPGAEYTQRLEAAAAANQLPHVIAAGYDALPLLNENGIVVPIDEFAQTGGYDASMFPEAIWNAGQWKDQRVGIPIDTHPMILYYNKKLFTDAGLDPEAPPADKASFEAAIKAIQEKTDADGLQMVASGPGANFLVGHPVGQPVLPGRRRVDERRLQRGDVQQRRGRPGVHVPQAARRRDGRAEGRERRRAERLHPGQERHDVQRHLAAVRGAGRARR